MTAVLVEDRETSFPQRTLLQTPKKLDHRYPIHTQSLLLSWRCFFLALSHPYLILGLIWRHEILVGPDLRQETLHCHVVICSVPRIVPIFDHLTEHSSRFPPIVWIWEQANCHSRLITMIVRHQTMGDCGSGCFDRVCILINHPGVRAASQEAGVKLTIKSYLCYQDPGLSPMRHLHHILQPPVLQISECAIVRASSYNII